MIEKDNIIKSIKNENSNILTDNQNKTKNVARKSTIGSSKSINETLNSLKINNDTDRINLDDNFEHINNNSEKSNNIINHINFSNNKKINNNQNSNSPSFKEIIPNKNSLFNEIKRSRKSTQNFKNNFSYSEIEEQNFDDSDKIKQKKNEIISHSLNLNSRISEYSINKSYQSQYYNSRDIEVQPDYSCLKCLICEWEYPKEMSIDEKNVHINFCLEGEGNKHRSNFLSSMKLINLAINGGMDSEDNKIQENNNDKKNNICPFCSKIIFLRYGKTLDSHLLECYTRQEKEILYLNKKRKKYE